MGPQLYRCRNIKDKLAAIIADTELQWGRNFIVAEIMAASPAPSRLTGRFNGAATLSLRKWHLGADNRFRL